MSDFIEVSETEKVLTETDKLKIAKNSEIKISEFKRNKLEIDARRHWDIFYKNNTTNFFKDRNWLEREFDALNLSSRNVILELGAGVGNTVFPLAEKSENLKIYAAEFSPRAVFLLNERAAIQGLSSRVEGHVSDITRENYSFLKEKVDVVFMIFVMSAISPQKFQQVIENLLPCLNPDAKVFFRDYAVNDHAMVRFKPGKCISDRFYVRQDGTRSYFFNLEELKELFINNGAKVQNLNYVSRKTVNKAENVNVQRTFLQGTFQF